MGNFHWRDGYAAFSLSESNAASVQQYIAEEIAVATSALRRGSTRTTERRRLAMAAAITLLAGVMLFAYVDPGWAAKRLGSVAYVDSAWANWAASRKSMALDSLRVWRDHPVLNQQEHLYVVTES